MHLGYPDDGHLTTYYPDSPDVTKAEVGAVADFMEKKGLLPENTRLRKTKDGVFEILIASAQTSLPAEGGDIGKETEFKVDDGALAGKTIKLVYGDHAKEMSIIAKSISKAAENADNDTQKKMHLEYAKSFDSGSLLSFKDSQRYWIRDKGPDVETNIGFIETYRDPAGVRGEWEGFAAVVNKERTRAFGELVSSAPKLIPLLPWTADFEKDKFLAPDFTSLEVLSFAGSGIPAGINIPNYDDIRQSEGFKNVSLGNVLGAKAPNEKIPFIQDEDLEVYQKYRDAAFEVQVGLHELTGHGCGKLLQETSPGVFNFDKENPPTSPLTNKPVTSWYKPGQTWGSVFGGLAGAYEECRAELVAMYLSCEFPVLKIFGFGDGTEKIDGEAGDLLYASYLSMARAGLASVEFWDPKSQKWGQPHCQARFAILKSFLQAGEDFCKLESSSDDLSDLKIKLNRDLILTKGRKGQYNLALPISAPFPRLVSMVLPLTIQYSSRGRHVAEDTHLQGHRRRRTRHQVFRRRNVCCRPRVLGHQDPRCRRGQRAAAQSLCPGQHVPRRGDGQCDVQAVRAHTGGYDPELGRARGAPAIGPADDGLGPGKRNSLPAITRGQWGEIAELGLHNSRRGYCK